jgi:tRNA nucleotidyltransferase/poly(A) polymerase
MIRAVQFAARFGFTIESETMKAIQQNANRIIEISPERILIEFDKIVKKGNPVIAAQLLEETGLFSYIFGNNPDEGVRINYEELKKAKTMGEFIYILAQGNTSFDSPSAFYKDKLKGDLDTYNEIRALEVAFKSGGYSTSIHVRLEIFKMYKLYPNSLNSPIIPQMVKDNIHKMKGSGMPFSMKELQINGNDLLAMGYTGIQIGELLKNLILDIYSGKLSNNRELLLKHLTPKEPNIEKSKL